ncbi:MAG: Cys-tRNA(Pro) deacylase [Bacteroidota bacterium]|nr:Cys-tRNA(Pro) deacylase [Bacteroidota bacterium]
MSKAETPGTAAVRYLREKKINFIPHFYKYEKHGGTKVASSSLNIPEHNTIKTIVMETDSKQPFIVLMPGDMEVSTKQLARIISVKHIEPCDERTAEKHTGYIFGGTSPFGTRKQLPVYVEKTIFNLNKIYINGGKRGFLVKITPKDLENALPITKGHL